MLTMLWSNISNSYQPEAHDALLDFSMPIYKKI